MTRLKLEERNLDLDEVFALTRKQILWVRVLVFAQNKQIVSQSSESNH